MSENRAASHVSSRLDPAIAAARAGDQHQFSKLTEPYRRELQVHCYRILGSLQDAEDLVQETLLRAWRRLNTYEGRAPLRAWLYRIATNACLDALDKRPRRALPATQQPPGDPRQPFAPPINEPIWLEPLPDDLLADSATSPEARYSARESVTLAFMAMLHTLPPRQRAVLVLRDVLDWRASEVADLLETSVSAVNSALHRARTTMTRTYHIHSREAPGASTANTSEQALLDRYLRAWEAADVAGLTRLLKEDATHSMPPSPSWYQGRRTIGIFMEANIFGSNVFPGSAQGRWLMRPTRANAQPAFALYLRDEASGVYGAFGIQVLTVEAGRIADLTTFVNPALVPRFGLPDQLMS